MSDNHSFEKHVLEAVLADNAAFDELALEIDDFTDRQYRRVFQAVDKLIDSGAAADIMSVASECPDLSPGFVGGFNPITAANAEYYAEKLKSFTRARRLAQLAALIQDGLKTRRDLDELTEEAEQKLLDSAERRCTSVELIGTALHDAIDDIERQFNAKETGGITGIPSGFSDLDKVTSGFQDGDLIILAARTSIGKTTFALNIAENVARHGIPVAFFSCEMSRRQLAQRILASCGRMNHGRIRAGDLAKKDFAHLTNSADELYGMPLHVDDTPNIPLSLLKGKTRILKRKGARLVIVDYLTLVEYGDRRMPRWERVGELVKKLKSLARELEIPIVALSQLNRGAEGQRPSLAELRQSGEVEEHSDIVMLMHREREKHHTELHVAKHRNGPTRTIYLTFVDDHTRFEPAYLGQSEENAF